MSKRAQIQKHLAVLNEISGIMGAMKNISLMETHKLARFLAHQHRVLAGIEAAATDFLCHHPQFAYRTESTASGVMVAIGSQRGFCGDFNESLVDAISQYEAEVTKQPHSLLVVGRRLASRLDKKTPVIASFDGPSVAEEVQPVLHRIMSALTELQSREGGTGLSSVKVIAHHEGDNQLSVRSILPAPNRRIDASRYAYPPLLNLAPSTFFIELAHHYLWAQMHDVFYSSLMAENRRRLQHMEGAIQRMDEKAGEMQRKHNMLRQEEITEEIEVIMLSNDALHKRAASDGASEYAASADR